MIVGSIQNLDKLGYRKHYFWTKLQMNISTEWNVFVIKNISPVKISSKEKWREALKYDKHQIILPSGEISSLSR